MATSGNDCSGKPADFSYKKGESSLEQSFEIFLYFLQKFWRLQRDLLDLRDAQLIETVNISRLHKESELFREKYIYFDPWFGSISDFPPREIDAPEDMKTASDVIFSDGTFQASSDEFPFSSELGIVLNYMKRLPLGELFDYIAKLMSGTVSIETIVLKMKLAKLHRAIDALDILAYEESLPEVVKKILHVYIESALLLKIEPKATHLQPTDEILEKLLIPPLNCSRNELEAIMDKLRPKNSKLSHKSIMSRCFQGLIRGYNRLLTSTLVFTTSDYFQSNCSKGSIFKVLSMKNEPMNRLKLRFSLYFDQYENFIRKDDESLRNYAEELDTKMTVFMRMFEATLQNARKLSLSKECVSSYELKRDGPIVSRTSLCFKSLQRIKITLLDKGQVLLDSGRDLKIQKYVDFVKSKTLLPTFKSERVIKINNSSFDMNFQKITIQSLMRRPQNKIFMVDKSTSPRINHSYLTSNGTYISMENFSKNPKLESVKTVDITDKFLEAVENSCAVKHSDHPATSEKMFIGDKANYSPLPTVRFQENPTIESLKKMAQDKLHISKPKCSELESNGHFIYKDSPKNTKFEALSHPKINSLVEHNIPAKLNEDLELSDDDTYVKVSMSDLQDTDFEGMPVEKGVDEKNREGIDSSTSTCTLM